MWAGFAVFVVVAIAIDLLVMERQGAHKVTMGEAPRWRFRVLRGTDVLASGEIVAEKSTP